MFTETDYLKDRKTSEIAQLIGSQNRIILSSNYKGVGLTQPVDVLNVTPHGLVTQAPDLTVCYTLKERVLFYNRTFRELASARLMAINTIVGKLELSDPVFTGWHWNERLSDRVQPQDPIYIYAEYKKMPIWANLDNLSTGGISLMTYKYPDRPVQIEKGSVLSLAFHLPGDDLRLDIKGKVIHEHPLGRLAIIGLQLLSSGAQEKRLYHYVMSRKAEILDELEKASREFLARQSMPNLYL